MINQTARRLPGIPGVRDVITAMDFVMAAVKTKDRSPEFVAFRKELLEVTQAAEAAVAMAGKADAIERLHGEAEAAKGAMDALLVEGHAEADRIAADAAAQFTERETLVNEREKSVGDWAEREQNDILSERTRATDEARAKSEGLDAMEKEMLDKLAELSKREDNVAKREKRAEARQTVLTEETAALNHKVIALRQAME